ncbi:MAG TPA: SCO family protein [Rhizomicrobium sp.]|jgi:protein SCO1/2
MKSWAGIFLAFLVAVSPATRASPGLPPIQGQFDLTTLDGRDVTLDSYKGKWLLIYFGYTFCPDVCPTVLTEMGGALKELGPKAANVEMLFITVDPARDSAIVMKRYLKAFDPHIQGLRGDPDAIEMAAKSFHVYYRARSIGGGEYAIDHSSYIYVLDPKGKFVDLLAADVPGHKIAADIRRLIH